MLAQTTGTCTTSMAVSWNTNKPKSWGHKTGWYTKWWMFHMLSILKVNLSIGLETCPEWVVTLTLQAVPGPQGAKSWAWAFIWCCHGVQSLASWVMMMRGDVASSSTAPEVVMGGVTKDGSTLVWSMCWPYLICWRPVQVMLPRARNKWPRG